MSYDPYTDIVSLLGDVKNTTGGISAQALTDLIKSNNSFYRSTYREGVKRGDQTADYIKSGQAYRDEGAQAIRRAYADYADTARDHTAAQGAADNGGNLDSYAAAQANRSAQAMLSAGEQAVAKRADGIHDALIAADKNAASVASDAISALSDSADSLTNAADDASDARIDALKALLSLYGVLNKPQKS